MENVTFQPNIEWRGGGWRGVKVPNEFVTDCSLQSLNLAKFRNTSPLTCLVLFRFINNR